ncbi:hypothetical protein, partial [Streptococcus oralis]|uniref:hypothetical protein n=1 Tax=Streptococcus oralis TaxID=1303 RepID=UPI001F508713
MPDYNIDYNMMRKYFGFREGYNYIGLEYKKVDPAPTPDPGKKPDQGQDPKDPAKPDQGQDQGQKPDQGQDQKDPA